MIRQICYLLHFIDPLTGKPARLKHAGHYLGECEEDRLDKRVQEHRDGRGAVLTAAARAAGLDFVVTRTWEGGRLKERQLKSRSGASYCPDCTPEPMPGRRGRRPGARYLTRRQREAAEAIREAEPERRLSWWEEERLGTWTDGTPVPLAATWEEARQYRAEQLDGDIAAQRAIEAQQDAALAELERSWGHAPEQEEPEMFGSKARAERRSQAEADRLFALADELEKQAPARPNYAREITAERAARMRARLGEDLVQDARAQAPAEGRAHEPELQGAELGAEIDRLADAFPESGIGGTTGIALSALSNLLPDLVPANGPAPQAGPADTSEPAFGPRPDGTYADAIDSDIAARAGEAEQLAAPQPDLSAEETQAFEQAERERWAQVDRDTEYMARQAAQYYGPEMADLLGIEPGDAVQAPDSPGWEFGDGVARSAPGLQAELLGEELQEHADRAAHLQRLESRANARQGIAAAAGDAATAAAAREQAQRLRADRLAAEAEAYDTAAALQEDAAQADREPGEGVASRSPELAPAAAAQPAGTLHADPALAERGWQADAHGVYARNPEAESPGPHREVAGYEAGAPDHFYGSPECAEPDAETAHFGNGPGEPADRGSSPQPAHRQAGPYYGGFACENFTEMREGVRQADAADEAVMGQPGGWPATYGAYGVDREAG